ncbi:methyltransferase-like protein 17, mitochondrial [Daktulosphaira vitifoliae]|uniref:methyltransferase-like protein 17, mitochondrial n=1 Tax=Daktulosphaira vitifoliae TaxID=58002 RepID=UPI0021AA510A|nr:methyltransferase-like protein 17, mitochondrial [Daktulosphaira vitifoliae]
MFSCTILKLCYSTKVKLAPILNETIKQKLSCNELKPRKHPGRCQRIAEPLPDDLVKSIVNSLKDSQIKSIIKDGQLLLNYLHSRHMPVEQKEKNKKRLQKKTELEEKYNINEMSDQQKEKFQKFLYNRVEKLVAQQTYCWKPIDFNNEYVCHQYLLTRIAPEYSAIKLLFNEIKERDPDFKPQSLFDFGSGIGTVTMNARNVWGDSLKEYYCVDTSSKMNDLSKLILQGGNFNNDSALPKGLCYRQFLPGSPTLKFDIVVSAYSLFELPDMRTRFETLLNLWNKTNNYIVLIEMGTRAGFEIINEARDLFLNIYLNQDAQCHVVSPCPHEHSCPRFDTDDTPCNFQVPYFTPKISQQSTYKSELVSYVIIKKGPRSINDDQWPRIVRPVLIRSKHSVCRMCTSSGKLEEIIFTAAKHGQSLYWCARSSKWGDRLPITIKTKE